MAPGTFVLFPLPGAPVLSPATAPARLVVIDATWRQARRMLRQLRGFSFVGLPPGARAQLCLREPPSPGCLSTVEAAARAVACLGHAAAAEQLARAIDLVAPRMMHVRSWIRRSDLDAPGPSL